MLLPIALALQAAAPTPSVAPRPAGALPVASAPAAAGERFSILAPQPCRATPQPSGPDIVVCATAENSARFPEGVERAPPNRPLPSNPGLDGMGALNAVRPVCAARQEGCQTGVDVFGAGTAAIRLVQKLVAPDSCCEAAGDATNPFKLIGDAAGGLGRAFKKKPDTSSRVPIDLSEPTPPTPRAAP